ncbi:MAG: flagellin [Alphaproteobacteria bacterium]|nr:MAG: flagellin [Alphaproteobacteria bacterium]
MQALKLTNKSLEATQNAISTGFRVATASDNAAYWSIATTMRSDNKALSTVQDALGLGAAKVDTAYTGLDAAIDVTSEIKAKLVAASEPGVDKTKINSEITQLKQQLASIVESASFSGENWLLNSAATAAADKSIVASFTRSATGNVSITTIDVTVSNFTLIGSENAGLGLLTKDIDANALDDAFTGTSSDNWFLLDPGSAATTATGTEISLSSTTTDAQVNAMIRVVDKIISDMTSAAADLGATKTRIDLQSNFVGNLMDAIDRGVGQLVDADMNQESTRLQALQVQQQLGIQALSIANSNSQNILSLFR